jgi:tight adherence protein B
MNGYLLSIGLLVLLGVVLLVVGAESLWSAYWGTHAAHIRQRLRVLTGELNIDAQSLVKTRRLSDNRWLHALLSRVPHVEDLDTFLTQAGLQLRVGGFLARLGLLLLGTLVAATAAGASGRLLGVAAVLPPCAWLLYLQHMRRQRVFRIEAQLPDTLDLMARAMQAGHAFSSALLIVGSEGSAPIRTEFQLTFDEINFGISTESALHHLTQRVASRDLRFFVVAVLIQLETGGNLTEILKSLAGLIRDRQRIVGTVRVLSAEGRLSAWILGLLPFGLAGILSVVNHGFISKLWTDPLGIRLLEMSLTLMAIGVWWMWRMVRVEI